MEEGRLCCICGHKLITMKFGSTEVGSSEGREVEVHMSTKEGESGRYRRAGVSSIHYSLFKSTGSYFSTAA